LETLFKIAEALDISLAELFIELEQDINYHDDTSYSAKLEKLMKRMSPHKKEWISEIVLKIMGAETEIA